MPIPTCAEMMAFLEERGFLTPVQVQQLRDGTDMKFADAQALARELVDRNWLTAYQAKQILAGSGPGLLVGPYRILDQLGEGGMGEVLKAYHPAMDRNIALKVIAKDRVSDSTAIARFQREVKAVAKLSHRNIVVAFDVNQVGQRPYMAMEYVEGIDLSQLVRQSGPLPIARACDYIRQAALGLQHAHEKGLVHRDIKPGNLLVARPHPDEPPIIKILDFGLARFESESPQKGRLTQLGSLVGTVDYIAPEQAQNPSAADIRADVYSLGCALFYLLTGNAPFGGQGTVERIAARVLGDAPAVCQSRPEVSPNLGRVLAKMMARHPAERYQTPGEVAKALEPHATENSQGARASTQEKAPKPAQKAPISSATVDEQSQPSGKSHAGGKQSRQAKTLTPEQRALLNEKTLQPTTPLRPQQHQPSVVAAPAAATRLPAPRALEFEKPADVVPAGDLDDLVVMDEPPRRKRTGFTVLLGLLTLIFVLCGGFGIVVAAVVIAGRDAVAHHSAASGSAPSTIRPPEPPPVDNQALQMPSLPELPPPSARTFDGHQSPIIALSFSHSGNFAFSAAGCFDQIGGRATLLPDNTLRAWDVKTGKETLRARNFRDGIATAAFSPDGHYAVLAGAGQWNGNIWSPVPDGLLHLWDLHKDQEIRVFRGHTKPVTCLAFSANGTRILSGSADNTVRLWNVETATEVYRLEGHTNTVNSVAFSSDGNFGLSGSADTTVRLWDLNSGTETRKLLGHQEEVLAVAISPTGKLAASGGGTAIGAKDVDIRLWDVETGQEVRRCRGHEKAVGCLAFSADGRRLISGAADKTVMLWQVANAEPLGRFDGHLDRIRAVAFFPDGKRALSGGDDRTLRVWEMPPGLPYWIDRLEDPDRLTRLDAARQLPRFGSEVRASLPQLLKAMLIDDNDFQLALLTVLAKLGPPNKSDAVLLPPLFKTVEVPAVRIYALESTAAQGADYPLTLPMLKDALADKDPTVKRKAVQLSGQLGAPARDTLYPALLEMLKAPDDMLSKEAGDALAKLGKPTEADLPVLNDLLRDQRPALRRYAVIAMGDLGPAAEKGLLRLTETFLVDNDPEMRRLALIALCKVQRNLKEIGRFLKDGLKDKSPEVNKEAVAISAALAPETGPLTILLESLNHPKPVVAKAAEDALIQVKFDRLHEKGLATALRACKSESARLRLMDTLVALKPETSEAGAALADFLKDAGPENRSKIIAAIGQLGKAGREAGPGLAALLKADDRLVRFEAAVALCKIQSDLADKAVPALVAALRVEKPDDTEGLARQLEAHNALVAIGKPAVDALAESLRKEFFGGNPMTLIGASKADARLAVIKTLEAIGADDKGAIQALEEEERVDPWTPNRKLAKEARLKIQHLADEKEKQR